MKRLLLIGAVVAAATIWALRARSSEVFPYMGEARTPEQLAALAKAADATAWTLMMPDETGLSAVVKRPRGTDYWFVWWHGNTGAYFEEAFAFVAQLKLPETIGVIIVAPRGFAGSGGVPSATAHATDAHEVMRILKRRLGVLPEHTVLGGFSMGTWNALASAEEGARGLVLFASFTENDTGLAGKLLRYRAPEKVYLFPRLPPQACSLVLHGDADEGFPPWMGRQVSAWLGPRSAFELLPGASHETTLEHPKGHSLAAKFITEVLAGGDAQPERCRE